MTTHPTLRWGIIGASSRIHRKSLRPAMLAVPGHEIVAEASRADGSETPYAELLARSDVDAVYIPLPNSGHKPWILAALDAGKHVLCEKPLTLSAVDTIEVFDAAEAAGRVLMEAYMWPHHPRAQRMLQLVADGSIGLLNAVRGVFTYPASDPTDHRFDERGAGALFDVGIYCIAPGMLMADRDHVEAAAVAVRNAAGIDVAMSGVVGWGQGAAGTFEVSFQAPHRRVLEITGTEGVVTHDGMFAPGPTTRSELRVQRLDDTVEVIEIPGADAFEGMIRQFAAVIAGTEAPVFGRTQSVRLARVLDHLHAVSAGRGEVR